MYQKSLTFWEAVQSDWKCFSCPLGLNDNRGNGIIDGNVYRCFRTIVQKEFRREMKERILTGKSNVGQVNETLQ